MALLSQVSTSYPRVPRDSFFPVMGYFHCLDTDTSHLSCYQHAACFFTYIDCRIQIPIYPISTSTKVYSVRKFQFFLYTATFTAFFTGRKKTVYTYQFLSSPCQLIFQQFPKLSVTVIHDTFSKMHTLAHCFHIISSTATTSYASAIS